MRHKVANKSFRSPPVDGGAENEMRKRVQFRSTREGVCRECWSLEASEQNITGRRRIEVPTEVLTDEKIDRPAYMRTNNCIIIQRLATHLCEERYHESDFLRIVPHFR